MPSVEDRKARLRVLQPRADRYHGEFLVDSWVPLEPASSLLKLPENQIIFGRRGSGKTHGFLRLVASLQSTHDLAIHIDLRNIGSNGGLYGDSSRSLAQRSSALLVDVMEHVNNRILDVATSEDRYSVLLPALEQLSLVALDVQILGDAKQEIEHTESHGRKTSLGLDAKASSSPTIGFKASSQADHADSTKSTVSKAGPEAFRILFGPLQRAWSALAESIRPNRIWIILDEWSFLPWDVQPILADMIRRSLLPQTGIVVKIAATEGASNFSTTSKQGGYVGIQIGDDVDRVFSLDDALRFGPDGEAEAFWNQLLARHTGTTDTATTEAGRLPFLSSVLEDDARSEFIRAAEGVPRDGIQIIRSAAIISKSGRIKIGDVRAASRELFAQFKMSDLALSSDARRALPTLAREVVAKRHQRHFLVTAQATSLNSIIQSLYEARLINPVAKLVMVDGFDETFDAYSLDFSWFATLVTPKLLKEHGEPRSTIPQELEAFAKNAVLPQSILSSHKLKSPKRTP